MCIVQCAKNLGIGFLLCPSILTDTNFSFSIQANDLSSMRRRYRTHLAVERSRSWLCIPAIDALASIIGNEQLLLLQATFCFSLVSPKGSRRKALDPFSRSAGIEPSLDFSGCLLQLIHGSPRGSGFSIFPVWRKSRHVSGLRSTISRLWTPQQQLEKYRETFSGAVLRRLLN
jgi:hypothetical protein